jgi:hypothetical protein
MHRDLVYPTLIILTIIIALPKEAFAWGGHKELTYYTIREIEWIKEYKDIKITPYTYTDSDGENPNYIISYKEGNTGDTIDSLTILTTYCEEPDWDLDKNVDSLLFRGMRCIGLDSSHWRHGYWVICEGLIELGGAVDRIEHYTNMSILAFKKKDLYWGFRFLARAIHYLEDITQPQHTYPVPPKLILDYLFNTNKLIVVASNHHFALEGYQGYNILIGYPPFVNAITSAKPMEVEDLKNFSREAAIKSKGEAPKLWELQSKLYGERIDEPTEFQWFPNIETDEALKAQYDNIIIKQLSDLSSRVKGLVLYVGKIVESLPYPLSQRSLRSPSKAFIGSFIAKGYTSYLSLPRRIINHRKTSSRDVS